MNLHYILQYSLSKHVQISYNTPYQCIIVHAGFFAANNVIRPLRFSLSLVITPAFDKIIDAIQSRTKLRYRNVGTTAHYTVIHTLLKHFLASALQITVLLVCDCVYDYTFRITALMYPFDRHCPYSPLTVTFHLIPLSPHLGPSISAYRHDRILSQCWQDTTPFHALSYTTYSLPSNTLSFSYTISYLPTHPLPYPLSHLLTHHSHSLSYSRPVCTGITVFLVNVCGTFSYLFGGLFLATTLMRVPLFPN